jgi:hypothetical protein
VEGEKMKIIPLENAHVSLKENDVIIYEGISDAVLKPDIYPRAGMNYSITVSHEKYPAVTAETCIPEPVKFEAIYMGDETYKIFEFKSAEMAFPLWITSTVLMSNTHTPPAQYTFLYTYNLLIDNINRIEGSGYVNKLVGNSYHELFFRIKTSNLPQLTDIVFSPKQAHAETWEYVSGTEIRLITASPEYDRYCKTYYLLLSSPPLDSGVSSIMYQPVTVYSNIKGGRGIFAGKSEFACFFEKE